MYAVHWSGFGTEEEEAGNWETPKKLGSFRPGLVATIARHLTQRSFQPNM